MKIKLILVFLLLCSLSLYAQSTEELRQKLESTYRDLSTWQARLTQTNYFAQIKQSTTYEGHFFYQPPRLLIRFDKPHQQRLQIEGKDVSLYDAQSKSLLKTSLLPEFERMNPIQILQHYWSRSQVEISKRDKQRITIILRPESDNFIKTLNAVIDYGTGFIVELAYTDFSGNTVTYKFSNSRANQKIDPAVWKFAPPADTQVIQR